jgi:GNAT superfamily N-acetyltransferase
MNHKPEPFTPNDPSFKALINESEAQGSNFVGRFANRWKSGDFLFDKPDEKLLAIKHDQQIIAFGGLCFDPYSDEPNAGRIRHLYVLDAWRGKGCGRVLVTELTQPPHPFTKIRLRADETAARFYEHLGWVKCNAENATHELVF